MVRTHHGPPNQKPPNFLEVFDARSVVKLKERKLKMTNAINFVPTQTGRLFMRHLKEGRALVGCLSFDPSVAIEEEKAYLLMMKDGSVFLSDKPVDSQEYSKDYVKSVDDLIKCPIWQKTTSKDALIVRFFKALPEENMWTVFGPSNFVSENNKTGEWWDVAHGRLREVAPPVIDYGMTLGQVLNQNAIWPSPSGVMYAIPAVASWSDALFKRLHVLMATAGATEKTLTHAADIVRAAPHLEKVTPMNLDKQFCRFLNKMNIHLDEKVKEKPQSTNTAADLKEQEDKSRKALDQEIVSETFDNEKEYSWEKFQETSFDKKTLQYQLFYTVVMLTEAMEELVHFDKTKHARIDHKEIEDIFASKKVWDLLKNQNKSLEVLVPMCLLSRRSDILEKVLSSFDWTSSPEDAQDSLKHFFSLSLLERYKTPESSALLAKNWAGKENHTVMCQSEALKNMNFKVCDEIIKSNIWESRADLDTNLVAATLVGSKNWTKVIDHLEVWKDRGFPLQSVLAGQKILEALSLSFAPLENEHLQKLRDLGLSLAGHDDFFSSKSFNSKNFDVLYAFREKEFLKEHLPKDKAKTSQKKM